MTLTNTERLFHTDFSFCDHSYFFIQGVISLSNRKDCVYAEVCKTIAIITCYCYLCKIYKMYQHALFVSDRLAMLKHIWNGESHRINYHLTAVMNNKRQKERTGKITCYCCLCKMHNMCHYALLVAGEFEMSIIFWNEERQTFNYPLTVAVNSKRPKGKNR